MLCQVVNERKTVEKKSVSYFAETRLNNIFSEVVIYLASTHPPTHYYSKHLGQILKKKKTNCAKTEFIKTQISVSKGRHILITFNPSKPVKV